MADFAAKDWRAATTIAPPPAFDSVQTREEVDYLIELAETTRPGRMDEIVEQDFGFHEFLLRVAMMTERSHPATFDLAKSAARVGEMLMSHYKWMYKRPRPQQLAPVLLPPIRSQAHAAYPSGHATTSRLIALCICDVVPHAMREALMRMSDRIGENREVAGVHYPSDTAGGKQLANKAHVLLESQCTTFQELRVEAAQEWA